MDLFKPNIGDKSLDYEMLIPQIKTLIENEWDLIANLANIAAALKEGMNFFWVGFYFVREDELVLGPFQGPVACTRIKKGQGVCGKAWQEKRAIIVPDVDKFEGHIACNSRSKSEIVVPAFKNGKIFLILDIDSEVLNNFNELDQKYLSLIITMVEEIVKTGDKTSCN